jgi:hypothetical protein
MLSGFMGLVKIALFWAPFAFVVFAADGCQANAVRIDRGIDILRLQLSADPPILLFLPPNFPCVFLAALAAVLALFINYRRPVAALGRRAALLILATVLSLANVGFAGYIFSPPSQGNGEHGSLLWGFWAILLSDHVILVGGLLDLKRITWRHLLGPSGQPETKAAMRLIRSAVLLELLLVLLVLFLRPQ